MTEDKTKTFLKECDLLYVMRTMNHAHLLRAIAAFTRGEQCGFIMPRARGSLRTFWETQDPSTYRSDEIISWLFTQLIGITDGLSMLHSHLHKTELSTHHGALTPDNILWFPGHENDSDTLSLGLLVIGEAWREKSYKEHVGEGLNTRLRYAARERPKSPIDDTWSLGLVFFEFVIWLIRGKHEAQKFRYHTSHVYLSDETDYKFEEWSILLMNDERCLPDTPLGELVTFIVRRLLLSHGDPSGDPNRSTASQFHAWVSQVRSAVNASGSSYIAVQQNLPSVTPLIPRARGRWRDSITESIQSPARRAIGGKFVDFNFRLPWRRHEGDKK